MVSAGLASNREEGRGGGGGGRGFGPRLGSGQRVKLESGRHGAQRNSRSLDSLMRDNVRKFTTAVEL